MNTIIISPVGTDLASRRSAALLRSNIENILSDEAKATLDFANVKSISESYADELFGILTLEHGLEVISIVNAERSILLEIVKAIRRRIDDVRLSQELASLVTWKSKVQRIGSAI